MLRIRSLVNAELVAQTNDGDEKVMQIGSGTYFEASKIEIYEVDGENLADITLLDGSKLLGITWGPLYFENHGVPEERKPIDPTPTDSNPSRS